MSNRDAGSDVLAVMVLLVIAIIIVGLIKLLIWIITV